MNVLILRYAVTQPQAIRPTRPDKVWDGGGSSVRKEMRVEGTHKHTHRNIHFTTGLRPLNIRKMYFQVQSGSW